MNKCTKEVLRDQDLLELRCYDCDQINECHEEIIKALSKTKECLEYFVKRVEEGSIRSKTTYAKYKAVLEELDK